MPSGQARSQIRQLGVHGAFGGGGAVFQRRVTKNNFVSGILGANNFPGGAAPPTSLAPAMSVRDWYTPSGDDLPVGNVSRADTYKVHYCITTWAYESRGGGGQGATALPNSGKTVGKIRAKQEECVKFRANQPFCPPPSPKSPHTPMYNNDVLRWGADSVKFTFVCDFCRHLPVTGSAKDGGRNNGLF